jgi:hypothetical protein
MHVRGVLSRVLELNRMSDLPENRGSDPKPWTWLGAAILLGVIVRILIWFVYEPIQYSDSGAYFRLAEALQDFSLSGYDGSRVPGYSLFIALLGLKTHRIWIAQMVLGVSAGALLFWITWRSTKNPAVGFAVAAIQSIFPASIFFEANLLTESLTLFLILLALALFLGYQQSQNSFHKLLLAGLLGFFAAVVGLVRPIFFPLTLWVFPFVWFVGGPGSSQRMKAMILYSIFPLILQGGWLYYMQTHYHVLSPTAIGGYSMVQHAGEFFEELPDESATIRDVYIHFRDEQIAERGSQNNAIWQAVPTLMEATGMSFYELSRHLNDLSWMLIRNHPLGYAANVAEGWLWFWKAPVYWRADVLSSKVYLSIIRIWVLAGRGLAVTANAAFILISGVIVFSRKVRDWVKIDPMLLLAAGLIWWTSILQSIFEHGDNPRFLVPLQMVVIYLVVRIFYSLRQSRVNS